MERNGECYRKNKVELKKLIAMVFFQPCKLLIDDNNIDVTP